MTYESTTTLNRIREADPCQDGWTKLLRGLGKTGADDEPLPLLAILDINGLDDALWVLSYAMPDDRLARHFQAWCAEQVLPAFEAEYPGDTRVRAQIEMLRNDDAFECERSAARNSARNAALSAAESAARGAAADAAWSASADAAWSAAESAARGAAADAAWSASADAAWNAARGAAESAAESAQEKQLRKMLEASE